MKTPSKSFTRPQKNILHRCDLPTAATLVRLVANKFFGVQGDANEWRSLHPLVGLSVSSHSRPGSIVHIDPAHFGQQTVLRERGFLVVQLNRAFPDSGIAFGERYLHPYRVKGIPAEIWKEAPLDREFFACPLPEQVTKDLQVEIKKLEKKLQKSGEVEYEQMLADAAARTVVEFGLTLPEGDEATKLEQAIGEGFDFAKREDVGGNTLGFTAARKDGKELTEEDVLLLWAFIGKPAKEQFTRVGNSFTITKPVIAGEDPASPTRTSVDAGDGADQPIE